MQKKSRIGVIPVRVFTVHLKVTKGFLQRVKNQGNRQRKPEKRIAILTSSASAQMSERALAQLATYIIT